jgi:hypothetical protein
MTAESPRRNVTAESTRLEEARLKNVPWRKWGPYLSERQWGTVREDYSPGGDAWNYFSHDQARSRAYRWGEDGLAGVSDDDQTLCFALALWNERDPILKERAFGLTNGEGNHGEDVKDYYYYLDSTPTHSYMKYLYKYPQAAFPYWDLVDKNRHRGRYDFEYELIDTGVFDTDRYFDVFVEYAKGTPEDILVRITVVNRGPDSAAIQVLPTLWFRNEWSHGRSESRPELRAARTAAGQGVIEASHSKMGKRFLFCENAEALLFTENDTNTRRIPGGNGTSGRFVKDGINDFVVSGREDAVNPARVGTKAAAHYRIELAPGETKVLRLRLSDRDLSGGDPFGRPFDAIFDARKSEADEFYRWITPPAIDAGGAHVFRQALAGMLWSKQYYNYDLERWLRERGSSPFDPRAHRGPRNDDWSHMFSAYIISMPDKWEYPWFAAWDLAFHVVALAMVDMDFAKRQLDLLLRELYMHPNGQLPAYEWNFSDVNPPVHAWATIFLYKLETGATGKGDIRWLERCFEKLLLNFTWWVNRKDRTGRNIFEGGFLGLDNIGVFDRSAPLPTGGYIEQADGTAWMAFYCQSMLEIALELARQDVIGYGDMALKFIEHFLGIGGALSRLGMWDEEDGFFYDVLRRPDGSATHLKVRSIVGLLPICAATVFDRSAQQQLPELNRRLERFLTARPELVAEMQDPFKVGVGGRRLASIVNETRLRRVLARMLDEKEFLSPYGVRSVSRYHAEHPYCFYAGGQEYSVDYEPAESHSGMFGGNSNWRGPIWMPTNGIII